MLTLLIPTHNRPSYLARCLSFLRSTGCDYDIVIADSSVSPTFLQNHELITTFYRGCGVSQLDCREMGFLDKLQYGLSTIESPFVAICGDDDFIVPSLVSECVAFLQKNDDYSHAHGRVLTFWEKPSTTSPVRLLRDYPQHSNEGDAHQRLVAHFSRYANNFYSVHRTEVLLHNLCKVRELNIGRGLKERLFAALDIANGKRKMLDGLFLLRQKGLTGMGEDGVRTLNDNPAEADYFDQISFGYNEYADFLRRTFLDQLSLTEHQALDIMGCVEQDFARWKTRKTRRAISGIRSHRIMSIPRQAYRSVRDFMDTRAIRSTLNSMERNALDMATAAICDFYASTRPPR